MVFLCYISKVLATALVVTVRTRKKILLAVSSLSLLKARNRESDSGPSLSVADLIYYRSKKKEGPTDIG